MPNSPQNLFKRIDLDKLYPPFRKKIEALAANCRARGVDYWAICGLRSVQEQNDLYAQGRTKPGNIVTNARGGQSCHNFGVAVDWCPDKDILREGLQPDYNPPAYKILIEEAQKLGLEPGGAWTNLKDWPHVQIPLRKILNTKTDLEACQKLMAFYTKGGLSEVFLYLDTFKWA